MLVLTFTFEHTYMVPMKGQLVTSPTLIQEFNQSHSDVFKIDCDRVHSRWRPDGDELQRQIQIQEEEAGVGS